MTIYIGMCGKVSPQSQRGKYPGATLHGETKFRGPECLDLKHIVCHREESAIYNYNNRLCSTTANILLSSTNKLFFAQTLPLCRTAEVKTMPLVSDVTKFDLIVFELQWRLWRHSSDHWGHHGPSHVRQMSNPFQHRVDTGPLSIQRVGL